MRHSEINTLLQGIFKTKLCLNLRVLDFWRKSMFPKVLSALGCLMLWLLLVFISSFVVYCQTAGQFLRSLKVVRPLPFMTFRCAPVRATPWLQSSSIFTSRDLLRSNCCTLNFLTPNKLITGFKRSESIPANQSLDENTFNKVNNPCSVTFPTMSSTLAPHHFWEWQ